MDNLQEAYLNVYEATAMAKRGLDEPAIRQQIAKKTGGGQAADRASALEKKPTYGDANKQKQRERLARTQRGDFRKTTSSSPGLHGYAHQSNDPEVKAKQAARGAQRSALTPNEKKQLNREEFDYNDLLKFLYFEGYAESYAEAEEILESIIEEDFDYLLEAKDIPQEVALKLADMLKSAPPISRRGSMARSLRQYAVDRNKKRIQKLQQNEEIEVDEEYKEPNMVKMKRQSYKHRQQSISQRGGGRGDARNRNFKMDGIIDALERGEDPRRDTRGGKRTEPEDHRVRFTTNQKPRPAKQPGVQKEEFDEILEAKVDSGLSNSEKARVRTARQGYAGVEIRPSKTSSVSVHTGNVDRKRHHRERDDEYKSKKQNEELELQFESVVEYLFVEGYADTIENAEIMAENISEGWVDEIMEARRSEKEGMGSPETRSSRTGKPLSGLRATNRERGAMGGRRFWSGGEGGSKMERGAKKVKGAKGDENKYTEYNRTQFLQGRKETGGKYSRMQRTKRGGDIESNF